MNKNEALEQIQQDIISFCDGVDPEEQFFTCDVIDQLCQIVVDNFKKLDS